MCFSKQASPTQTPIPPPPAPAPVAPTPPVLNQDTVNAQSAEQAVAGQRRGKSSLKIDMGGVAGGSGLNIPT